MELPIIDTPIVATCRNKQGVLETHQLKRVKTPNGWQWQNKTKKPMDIEVIHWEYKNQLQLF